METIKLEKSYDVVVVGGGVSGVCAAIASARNGAKTAIIQNRPVFGGNASSEIRMHICGACMGSTHENARETGIVEEMQLKNRMRNPQDSFSVFDSVLWEMVKYQENLDMYLNTHMYEVNKNDSKITDINCTQLSSETSINIKSKYFIDATGDGTLGAYANAEYMYGREAKETFNENHAPDVADNTTMGSTIMIYARDMGKSMPFEKPFWAYSLEEDDLKFRNHSQSKGGYWWIELGGDDLSTITDNEEIRDELMKWAYGVWDHIKNKADHGADTYALDWVCALPGKRESRRLVGDYILKEKDILDYRIFNDAIAYGGWPMDMHIPGGIASKDFEPTEYIFFEGMYSIPYRTIYSKNVDNLFIAGRAFSTSRMAFGSTRVMGTTGIIGEACGVAAAIANKYNTSPRGVNKYINELKNTLAKEDLYIMGHKLIEDVDIAKKANITSSSGDPSKIQNGYTRNIDDNINQWISDPMNNSSEWISLKWNEKKTIREYILRFDSNLSKTIRISMSYNGTKTQIPGIPPTLIKDYDVLFILEGKVVKEYKIKNNYLRYVKKEIEAIEADEVMITIKSTHGDTRAKIFDVNIYE